MSPVTSTNVTYYAHAVVNPLTFNALCCSLFTDKFYSTLCKEVW